MTGQCRHQQGLTLRGAAADRRHRVATQGHGRLTQSQTPNTCLRGLKSRSTVPRGQHPGSSNDCISFTEFILCKCLSRGSNQAFRKNPKSAPDKDTGASGVGQCHRNKTCQVCHLNRPALSIHYHDHDGTLLRPCAVTLWRAAAWRSRVSAHSPAATGARRTHSLHHSGAGEHRLRRPRPTLPTQTWLPRTSVLDPTPL